MPKEIGARNSAKSALSRRTVLTPPHTLLRWTPSYVLDTDCDGNRVTPTTKLSQECIYKKKTEEIKQKQAINALNAEYKVEKLAQLERQAAERTAKNAARAEEVAARQAKYANRR